MMMIIVIIIYFNLISGRRASAGRTGDGSSGSTLPTSHADLRGPWEGKDREKWEGSSLRRTGPMQEVSALNPKPYTLHPTTYTLNLQLCTLHPTPYTYTLNPKPLNPKLNPTLNPTLNPKQDVVAKGRDMENFVKERMQQMPKLHAPDPGRSQFHVSLLFNSF